MSQGRAGPEVTIAVPVLNEEHHIVGCLDAIAQQTYSRIVEVLVVDGGSTDRTRQIAEARGAVVLDNPGRIQAAGLNLALEAARGELFVRVDGHCRIAPDYVEQCVRALHGSGAALVGGAMTPDAAGWRQRGIAAAMSSPYGAGPARFHVGGEAGWVDTVYLGAFVTSTGRGIGGYAEDVGVNEDSEFAIRMARVGGVWFDPAIRSRYVPRASLSLVAKQFYRYGASRAATVRRHPARVAPRQLAAPILVLALLSPWRRSVGALYAATVFLLAHRSSRDPRERVAFGLALPTMHMSWGAGFILGICRLVTPPRRANDRTGRRRG